MSGMRTTITLEPDVDALVRSLMSERGLTFKAAVNEAIRAGAAPRRERRVEVPVRPMGPARVDLDQALQLAGQMEDEEVRRKLELRK